MLARRRNLIPYLLLAPGLLWLIVFFAWPLVQVFLASFWSGSVEQGYSFSLSNWTNYPAALDGVLPQVERSLLYALVATVLTLLIAYPLAYTIAVRGGRAKNLLLFLVVAPFFTSYLLRTISWKILLGDNGVLFGPLKSIGLVPDDFRVLATPMAVVAGITYNFLPFMVLPIYASLERLDPALIEAAKDLYSSPRAAFWRVTLPLSAPGLVAGTLLTFIPAVGDYVNAFFLGSTTNPMIGNVIQGLYLTQRDYPAAAALSFVLMAVIMAVVFVYIRFAGSEALMGEEAAPV